VEFAPLLGVGLRHLVAMGGIGPLVQGEPLKQIRLKYDLEDEKILDQLAKQFDASKPHLITAALECASRSRLNPEVIRSGDRRSKQECAGGVSGTLFKRVRRSVV
jgi:hypothetical protein